MAYTITEVFRSDFDIKKFELFEKGHISSLSLNDIKDSLNTRLLISDEVYLMFNGSKYYLIPITEKIKNNG